MAQEKLNAWHIRHCVNRSKSMVEVWDLFLVKQIESLESVQSKAVCFIGNLRGRGGVSKKERNWVLTCWLTGKKQAT